MTSLQELQDLKARVTNDDPDALYLSGMMFWTGRWIEGVVIPQDKRKALYMIQHAADYGHEAAELFIAEYRETPDVDAEDFDISSDNNKDINEYDENGRTPLMNAAIAGDYDEVKRLLKLGADPNIADRDWGTTKAQNFAGRRANDSYIHKEIEQLLAVSTSHSEKRNSSALQYNTSPNYRKDSYSSSISLSGWLYILGFISLILAPFTGITVVTAAAFFVIAWVLDHQH